MTRDEFHYAVRRQAATLVKACGGKIDLEREEAFARLIGAYAEAMQEELRKELGMQRTVLAAAATRFEEYVEAHRAKGTPEGDAKARRNAEMAAACRAVG